MCAPQCRLKGAWTTAIFTAEIAILGELEHRQLHHTLADPQVLLLLPHPRHYCCLSRGISSAS